MVTTANCCYDLLLLSNKARFPFKRNRLRCVRCVNENRKKRKRLRWQAANHGCHCFDRAFLLAGACSCCVTTQAIAFEWKPGLTRHAFGVAFTVKLLSSQ